MHQPNHRRPAPEPVATVSPTVVPLEQRPMPVTDCPRLRRMREPLAEEEAAKFRDDRAQRQATAIDRWRAALLGGRQSRVLPAWKRSARCRHVARRDRFDPPTESWVMLTIRLSDAIRSRASYGRLEDHRADWRPDHRDDRVGSSVTAKCLSLSSAAIINRTASQERTIWTPPGRLSGPRAACFWRRRGSVAARPRAHSSSLVSRSAGKVYDKISFP
jgi:hypothetical protein